MNSIHIQHKILLAIHMRRQCEVNDEENVEFNYKNDCIDVNMHIKFYIV